MITINEQQKMLISVGKRIKKKITAYAVGGTAMMFHGLKESTLDIDLVFTKEEEQEIFKKALQSLGWESMDPRIIYGMKKNRPYMMKLGDARFDLFLVKVVNFTFSESMKKRATMIRQYDDNLIIHIADLHDIILMKCATDRAKDKEDVKRILEYENIKWEILIEESKKQVMLGEELAVFELGCFLEHLKNEMKLNIPQKVLDALFKIVEQQVKSRK